MTFLWPLFVFFYLSPSIVDELAASKSDESIVDRSYVKKKLEHGLSRIWQVCLQISSPQSLLAQITPSPNPSPQDVQLKVKSYILGTDMSNFKYDDFIVVLDVISRYISPSASFLPFSTNCPSLSCSGGPLPPASCSSGWAPELFPHPLLCVGSLICSVTHSATHSHQ